MRPDQVEEVVRLLTAVRSGAAPSADLPAECRPQSDADAYEIQDAVTRHLGETIGGWKIGIASAVAPAFCAPIYARMIRLAPATYTTAEVRLIGIEGELALRLGRDLPPRDQPYQRDEVIEGASLHPAIEVVDSRFVDPRALLRPVMLADNYANGGLVYGPAVPDWQKRDLTATKMTITANGEPLADSSIGPTRDPAAALVEFANLMRGRGGAKAGWIITTGSWTGLEFTRRGACVAADFGPFGRIEVAFPG